MEQIKLLLDKLKSEGIKIKSNPTPFNMLHIIYQEVERRQEKVHDLLLAGLLDPNENHELEYLPLNEFLKEIKVENITLDKKNAVVVDLKHYVKNQCSIDIFISWKDNNDKDCAIIIEDKLHGAKDQEAQLERYYNDIKDENFDIKKVVYIPFSKTRKSFKDQGFSEKIAIDFDAKDIVEWLGKCIEKAKEEGKNIGLLEQYKIFFKCLINEDFKMETATKIIECLSDEEINELEVLARKTVNSKEWCEARFEKMKIADCLKDEFSDIEKDYNPETRWCNYAQFWLKDRKHWIEIWLGDNKKIYLYVCSYEQEDEGITISGITYKYDESDKYYYYCNEDMVFDSDKGIGELVKRTIDILKGLPPKES